MTAHSSPRVPLRELRRARRRHYLREGDWVDSLYKAYIVAIVAALALFYGTVALGGDVDPTAITDVRLHGGSVLGLGLAVLVALGLRSGARGGPLAPEPADVTYLLLAPIDRGAVLRSIAIRQMRGVVLVPAVIGAVAGNVATSRLGGDRAEWIAVGAAFGALASFAVWGAALVASGARLHVHAANAIGVVLVAWAAIDMVGDLASSPTSQVARVALLPITPSALAVLGLVLPVALVGVGLLRLGHTSLEPLRHRARLIGELRFAATLQDMRSVIVLHRELAQELPRSRPWWEHHSGRGGPAWQRDWRGLARWPVSRVLRTVVLAAVVALAGVGLWHGVDALVLLAGLTLFLVGVDAVEGLAQEHDHAERPEQYPIVWGDLVIAHLFAPAVILIGLMVAAVLATATITGSASELAVGAITALPAALAGVVAAGVSVVIGAPPPTLYLDFGFPELTTLWLVLRQVLAPLLVVVAFVPLAVARHAFTAAGSAGSPTGDAVGAALATALVPILLVIATSMWLRSRRVVTR